MALIVMSSATSTMDVAKEMLKLGRVTVDDLGRTQPGGVMALDQTAGRGQRGRTWYSAPGESLCVTYFVPLTNEEFREASGIAILAGAAVANALDGISFASNVALLSNDDAPDEASPASSRFGLKWPNDVIASGKKLGGILVEIVPYSGGNMIALIGVGLNVAVRQFPADLADSCTSLAIEGLIPESQVALADSIRESLDRCIAVQSRYGFSATIANWRQYDTTAGRQYRIETESGPVTAEAVEVDSGGKLVVRTEAGIILRVLSASAAIEI